jgi:alanine dehydrogenase
MEVVVRIGVPKELKDNESRVALTPAGAQELIAHGHEVLIETGAGEASSLPDSDYLRVGARILNSAVEVWGTRRR